MTDYIELLKIEAYAKLKWLNFEIKRMSKYEFDHPSVLLDLLNTQFLSINIGLLNIYGGKNE